MSAMHSRPGISNLSWALLLISSGFAAALLPAALAFILLVAGVLFITAMVSPAALLVATLILSPLRTLIATEASWPLPLDIGQILFLLYIMSYGVHYVIKSPRRLLLRRPPLILMLIAFILALMPGSFIAPSLSMWLNEWLKWVIIAALACLIWLDSSQNWQWLIFGLVMAAVSNAVIGLYIFLGGSGADHLVVGERFFRAFGTFGQPNPFGGFMGLIAPLALMMTYAFAVRMAQSVRMAKSVRLSLAAPFFFYGLSSVIIIAALLASWSRGAWLGFVVSAVVMALALPRNWKYSLVATATAVVLVSGLWFSGLLPQSVIQRVASSTEEFFAFDDVRGVDITPENYAVVERLAHWQAAINMFESAPWLGIGFGNYEVVYKDFRLLNWQEALGHAHNYYLNILAEAGIIGALSYGVVFLGILIATWFARRHPNVMVHAVCVGLLGSWSYLLFHSLLDNLYVNNVFLHLATMLGVLMIMFHKTHDRVRWS